MQKFTIQIQDRDIEYLRQRLANARWVNSTIDNNWEKGVPVEYLKKASEVWHLV